MCMITVYKGSIGEENKIASDVTRYTLDLAAGKLTLYPMLKQPQELKVSKGINWDESNDTMVID